ncbi:Translocase of chloroplast, chloroplastic [Melia azedarach]|uniref:Translocase of chloroplast, chloroplastic n=1 Tax=Melia azedarach TaxID=155640 RepID=A0ACC1YEG4_MELAZ|nr:Translocase of chloroplast, chloroplastic [Melia azedarach]
MASCSLAGSEDSPDYHSQTLDLINGSFLIRAPLTVDDDDDDDSYISESPNARNVIVADTGYGSSNSISSIDSEGSVSAEEFESASERPFVADPDEEIVEENGVDGKYRASRLLVVYPDEGFSQNSMVSDEESGAGDEHYVPFVNLGLVDNVNVKPIAQLSMDDDGFGYDELSGGDEGLLSEEEDSGFSPVVKVPSMGRVDSAPRIKVMESEGEDEPLSEPQLPEKFADNSAPGKFDGVNLGPATSAESFLVNSFADDSVSAGLVEDKGNGEDVFEFVKKSVEQGSELGNSVEEEVESNDWVGHETEELSAGIGSVSGQAFVPGLNHLEELKVEEAGESAEEPSDFQNNQCSNFAVSANVSHQQESDRDNLESKTDPEIDLGIYLYDPLSIIIAKPLDGANKGKKIQAVDSKSPESNPSQQNGIANASIEGDRLEDAVSSTSRSLKIVESISISNHESEPEAEDDIVRIGRRQKGLLFDEDVEELTFGSSGATKQIVHGLEASSSLAGSEDSPDHSQSIDAQIVIDADDELDSERGGEGNELFDSATLVALLKSATSAALDDGGLTITRTDGSKVFTHGRPSGSGTLFPPNVDKDVSKDNLSEEEKRKIEKIQLLRVKFLRLVQRLGQSFDDSIVAQVLYRLALAFGRHSSQAFSLESAKRVAVKSEAENKDDLDFSLNILVLGKTGVGKSATINSIFGEEKATINAFKPATTSAKVIAGTIHGVKIRILDTPGLRSPGTEQTVNQQTLASIKKAMKKFPPDVVLYVDRLDTHTKDHNDLPLLKSLTDSLNSSIWQNAIVCLTHAASDPPDGPSGLPVSYEVFVAQRLRVIQQNISQAVGDLRLMNPSTMYPVSLVENHQSCQKNGIGESVLPNGQSWRPQLMLLCFSLKILSEANFVSKPQDPFNSKNFFGFCRSAPLSYLLSSLLQSRTHPKLSADLDGDDVDSDVELGDSSGSIQEDEDEYDQLPPFKPLSKSQVAKLSREQRKAYFGEYDYRVKLLQKKQWKEEVKRLREMKKNGNRNNYDDRKEDGDVEDESPTTVPVALPDFVLPPSFDGDNPAYRYRYLEPTSQILVRPVLDSHTWDHDCGYDGVSLERNYAIANKFPGAFAVQITKDKKEFNIHLDSSISAKHGENGSTMTGLDIQNVGRQMAYIFRGETKFRNFKVNKTSAGLSVTLLGENVVTGLKIEDQMAVGKCLILAGNAGAVQSRGDTAYGANLELCLKDFPIGRDNSSLGLSMVNWRGDQSLTANLQSQFSIGRNSTMAVRVGLNNKRSGQISVKLSSSEQLQMALIGILPIAMSIFRIISPASGGQKKAY